MSYILQFIDSGKFMASSLSNLVSNLSKRIQYGQDDLDKMIKNVKLVGLNISIAIVFLNNQILKMI